MKFLLMLNYARKAQMCMTPSCGTCAATPFMELVERNLGLEEFVPWKTFFQQAQYRDLLLGKIVALNEDHANANFDALKLFLTLAFAVNPLEVQVQIENKLAGTPAGLILDCMKKHYETRLAKQALSDPKLAKIRREEKKKVKAKKHLERVEFYRSNPFHSKQGGKENDRSE